MFDAPLLNRLIDSLRCLPGVGPKTAQRMAFHILERDRQGGQVLAQTMQLAIENIGHCQRCRTLTEDTLCQLCTSSKRVDQMLCIVESPSDVLAIEQATDFRGRYFVLGGRLSPLDGIGPEELGLGQLEARLQEGQVKEVILATNTTVEGEATAHYISGMAQDLGIKAMRIAHGVPIGGEIEYTDSGTLAHAFAGRQQC